MREEIPNAELAKKKRKRNRQELAIPNADLAGGAESHGAGIYTHTLSLSLMSCLELAGGEQQEFIASKPNSLSVTYTFSFPPQSDKVRR